jgi:uncharacterized protein
MRMPTIERRRRPSNRRILLISLAAVLVVLLVSLRGIAGFYTDYLWFEELGYTDVWRGLLLAKALPTAVFTVVFFLLILGNLIIADRLQPRFRPAGPEEELVERYRQFIGPYAGRVRLGVAAFLAVVAASGLTSQWNAWILFRNRVPFGGRGDPQFGADIGFYVFTLPFLRFIFEWTFAALVIVLLVTAVAHYLNGGIRVQGPLQRVTPQVKAHLSVLLGAMALLKAFGYWLQRFELNFSGRGAVDGASYTDVKAQLPALNMLIVISIAAAVLFFVNRWLKGWVLPVIAVGLWSFVSVVIGSIYPTIVQKASVEPNELQKESKYIQRNIDATRAAFGLTNVALKDFAYKEDLSAAGIRTNEGTIDDVRLWDPHILQNTYTQLQQFRDLYTFRDVDIDRYKIGDKTRQVVIAAREIDLAKVPSQTWQNRHLVYTHGYGIVASPSNGIAQYGNPEFIVKDIPPQGSGIDVTQPAIYFGENLPGYAFVNTKVKEFDYPRREGGDAVTTYGGKGGVKIGNIFRRTALFLRFGDIKVLISGQITPNSRALYLRDIRDRVRKAAPFLKFDADPYPVVVNKRILWVIDGYTVSDRYPYSQSYTPGTNRLSDRSGLQTRLNYVRNSVKATVDAYDGTVKFYVYDDPQHPDPIVRAYRKAFPKLFSDRSQMPEGLVDHLRYPEDLFRVQTDQFGAYHVTEPSAFYGNAQRWVVAQDPGSGDLPTSPSTAAVPQPAAPGRPAVTPTRRERMDPYYLEMRLPGQADEGFLILQPFVPVASGNTEPANLTSFMVAKSDPAEYGRLEAYAMPGGQTVVGPEQIDSVINSTQAYSERRTLIGTGGSRLIQGSLILVPVEQSLLYIRPFYVEGTAGGHFPQFRFLAVVYGNRAVLSDSLPGALSQLFPDLGPPPPAPVTGGAPAPPGGGAPVATDVAGLLTQANTAYTEAQTALKAGNLADYQRAVDRMAELIRQAQTTAGASTTSTTGTTRP